LESSEDEVEKQASKQESEDDEFAFRFSLPDTAQGKRMLQSLKAADA
jgi:hypothetical protein